MRLANESDPGAHVAAHVGEIWFQICENGFQCGRRSAFDQTLQHMVAMRGYVKTFETTLVLQHVYDR